jgi:hypothetical protein
MIKSRTTYDALVKAVQKFDEPQPVFIPELGKATYVVLIEQTLYVANTVEPGMTWRAVDPEHLSDTAPSPSILPPPSASLSNSLLNSPVGRLTPPPPYNAEAAWPEQTIGSYYTQAVQTEKTAAVPTVLVDSSHLAEKVPRFKQRHPSDFVNVETGKPVLRGAPKALSRQAYRLRQLVDPNTGFGVDRTFVGSMTLGKYLGRRLVDEKTGRPATADTVNPIFLATFRSRRARKKDNL